MRRSLTPSPPAAFRSTRRACVLALPSIVSAALSAGARLIQPTSDFGDGTVLAWLDGEHVLPGSYSQQIVIDGDSVRFAYDLTT
jgi:hypothetical protein